MHPGAQYREDDSCDGQNDKPANLAAALACLLLPCLLLPVKLLPVS